MQSRKYPSPFREQRISQVTKKPVTRKAWHSQRTIINPKERQALVQALKSEFLKPEFYTNWGTDGYGDRIKLFKFKGKEVLLKLALDENNGLSDHGKNPELLRHAILEHQKAVRAGRIDSSKYVLVTPKLYAKIGNLLIMEKMPVVKKLSDLHGAELTQVLAARKQLEANLWKLFEQGVLLKNDKGITPIPQASGIMYLGEMNERVLLALPYDVH